MNVLIWCILGGSLLIGFIVIIIGAVEAVKTGWRGHIF